MAQSFAFSFLSKLYQKNVAYANCENSIEYSGRYDIIKEILLNVMKKRCIRLAYVNFFKICNSFAANQYLMLDLIETK